MKIFITAIPLFNASMEVEAYRMCDQTGDKALRIQNDFRGKTEAVRSPGLDLIEQIGIEPLAVDKPLFVDINHVQLMKGTPAQLGGIAPSRLVCVLPGNLPDDPDLLERCRLLAEKGYPIALEGMPLQGAASPYFTYADYFILPAAAPDYEATIRTLTYEQPQLRFVVADVADNDTFQRLGKDRDTRKALFSGFFYSRPITRGVIQVSPLKMNTLRLLREISQEDFELRDISDIVGRDPALTVSLLKFINSMASGLARRVDSIQSAVAIMGQQEVRRWGMVATAVTLAEDRPGEVTRLSLIRAKFAENLAGAFELGVFQNQLFITGLFSLLDVILRKPMELAIKEVAVDGTVHEALVNHTGRLYPVLDLIFAYEKAEWDKVSILMIHHGTDIETISTAFVDALVWYNKLLTAIDEENPEGDLELVPVNQP